MANKRDMKKAIYRACSNIAGECIFIEQALGGDAEQWNNIIVKAALLQEGSIKQIASRFDKQPSDFDNPREYRKARRAFYKQLERDLIASMQAEVAAIAEQMNAVVPKKN